MDEAGMGDFEHELFSIDDAWRKDTTDAVAAQLRDWLDLLERLDEIPVFLHQLEPATLGCPDLGIGISVR